MVKEVFRAVKVTNILHLLFTTGSESFQHHKSKTNHSEYPDHRAIMVLFGRRGFQHPVSGMVYITSQGFNQPDTHQQTASLDKQLKRR